MQKLVKFPGVLLMVVLSAVAVLAQNIVTTTNAPGIEVISPRWHREERNPALLDDPLVYGQNRNPERTSKEVDQQDNTRLKANRILLPESPKERTQRSTEDASTQYVYEVRILNTGGQTIRRIDWQFDLLEPTTQTVAGHHTFVSKTNVHTGKTTRLVERSRSSPMTVVDAATAGEKPRNQYVIQVIINRIQYDDGSVWVRPSN